MSARPPRLRIAIIGSARFGFREPFAGGLEAHTADLTYGLRARGHEVMVYSGPESDVELGAVAMWNRSGGAAPGGRVDMSSDAEELQERLAYQRTVAKLVQANDVDLVHLNCCHHLPVVMAPELPMPVTATLHSPATTLLDVSYARARAEGAAPTPVAVSHALARSWHDSVGWSPGVIENGVDLELWQAGPGDGGYAVWSGRIVPEKAPHLAIDAARLAGLPIVLAGPRHDPAYWVSEIAPRLGSDVTYAGHLARLQLSRLVGRAAVSLVTPAWDEPFGLVAVEALASGTPVVAIGHGALPDLIDNQVGALVEPTAEDLVGELADAVLRARTRDRRDVRQRAELRFDLARTIAHYEALFLRVHADERAPTHRHAAHAGAPRRSGRVMAQSKSLENVPVARDPAGKPGGLESVGLESVA